MKTEKVKILRTTMASGKRVVRGKVYSLSTEDANYLVAIKKATFDLDVEVKDEKDPKNKNKDSKE